MQFSLSLSLSLSHTEMHAHMHTQERGPVKHLLASLQSCLIYQSINEMNTWLWETSKASPSGWKLKLNLASAIDLSETTCFTFLCFLVFFFFFFFFFFVCVCVCVFVLFFHSPRGKVPDLHHAAGQSSLNIYRTFNKYFNKNIVYNFV